MKRYKKAFLMFLISAMIAGSIYPNAFALENWNPNDPITDEWKMIDILVARPMGIVAGILGTGIFILSLPYTIPTGGVDEAANTFIKRPFKFSFTRKCPDEDM